MGQPLKAVDVDGSPGSLLAAELRRHRIRNGLSQEQLGRAVCHSGALVSKIERARRTPTLEFCQLADAVLDTGGALVRLWASSAAEAGAPDGRPVDRIRRALGTLGVDDGDRVAPDLGRVERAVIEATYHRLHARYGALAEAVPDLIVDLATAEARANDVITRRRVAMLLALCLRAADGLAFKLGHLDLSARLVDLMTARAVWSEDPALVATAAYVGTETYFASGDLDTGHRALVAALDSLPAGDVPSLRAARGALHMRAAVVSARRGRADDATSHLADAERLARRVSEGVYHGTAFGPASLRIHQLAVAAELGDPAGVERATNWAPPAEMPAERRSHYFIELSRAQLALERFDAARASVAAARRIAPQHTSRHPQVLRVVAALRQAR